MPVDFLKDFGQRVAARRKFLGITQEEIAEQLEVSTQMISNLECGRKAVRLQNLVRLATVLDTSIDFLLTGKRFSEERNDLSRKVVRLSDDDAELINVIVNYCLSRHTTNVPSSSHEHF